MAVMDWVGERLGQLQAEFPEWDIWHVRYVVERGGLWCARPKGTSVSTVRADGPDALREALLGHDVPEEPVTGKLFYVNFPRQSLAGYDVRKITRHTSPCDRSIYS